MDNNRNDRNSRRYSRSSSRNAASQGSQRSPARYSGRGKLPVAALVIIDVLGLALVMGVFSLFYFLLPSNLPDNPIDLPKVSSSLQATISPEATSSESETDATTTPDDTAETEQPTEQATATPEPAGDQGMFGAKFADKFASGDVEKTDTSYKSRDISVTLEKVQKDNVTYFVADIYVRNLENFRAAFAKDKPGLGQTEATVDMAKRNNAVVAISGDYYGAHKTGIVIRNGTLYRETSLNDVLIMSNDGSMQTFTNKEFKADDVKQNGAWQAWTFGPMLLNDGQPMEKFNSDVPRANPRAAIGYYEPGHYCFLLVDGRQPGYSEGMSLADMSQLFFDMGCKVAYNLDGGASAIMAFDGKLTNKPTLGGRKISDIVYIGEKTN